MPHLPSMIPIIIFEDVHLIVISKPAGLLSQGEHTGDVNVVDWLRERLGRPYVGLVHRLDRNTSGLMVVAKRTKAAQRLTESLQKDELKRVYRAWIVGHLSEAATWSHQLLKDERTNTVRVVRGTGGTGSGKRAILSVRPIQHLMYNNRYPLTLAEFILETGRSHQIRVQSAAEGFPVLGDHKYDGGKTTPMPDFPRTALHSFGLSFPHPMTKEILTFEDTWPADLTL